MRDIHQDSALNKGQVVPRGEADATDLIPRVDHELWTKGKSPTLEYARELATEDPERYGETFAELRDFADETKATIARALAPRPRPMTPRRAARGRRTRRVRARVVRTDSDDGPPPSPSSAPALRGAP
jgi:hypothetical protein